MGRHGVPDGEPDPADDLPPAGRRRAPDAPEDLPPWPDDDELTTLGRRTRAERRREGLLPRGEDPTAGRGPGAPPGGPGAGDRPAAQAGPRTYVTGIPAVGPRDTAPPVGRGPTSPPPPPRPTAPPTAQQPVAGPTTPPPVTRGPATPPPPATRGLPTPPPPVGPGTDGGPRTGGSRSGGPSTTVDPLPGSRPPAGRAPETPTPAPGPAGRAPRTSGLPSWATSPGPPTPTPGPSSGPEAPRAGRGTPPPPLPTYDGPERRTTGRPGPLPSGGDRRAAPPPLPVYDGPERRVADRPDAIPAEGDRRGARTHSIPERPPLSGGGRPATPPPAAGPGTGPEGRRTEPGSGETGVIGGRAASRAERQAVDAVRRREERRQGITPIPPTPGEEGRRGSRGLVAALVAVVVVALVLLGFWSFQRPTEQSAASTPVPTSSSAAATSASTPPTTAVPTATAPAGPVFAPVTVLNATDVDGLAGEIGSVLTQAGWEVRGEGQYPDQDVAVTTVFYTAGDATQEAAAATLQEQFPDIVGGPSERFFEVDGQPDPGLVVVATGSWQP